MTVDPLNSSNLEQLVLKELSQLSQVSQSMLPMSPISSLTFAWSDGFSRHLAEAAVISDQFHLIGLYSLTLSPLSSHSMGSPDRKLPDNLICNSFFFKISKPIFRLYGNKSKTCRPVFRPYGNL